MLGIWMIEECVIVIDDLSLGVVSVVVVIAAALVLVVIAVPETFRNSRFLLVQIS